MYTKCRTKQPVPWDRGSRMRAVRWWIEMSDGHNRGRTLNWLTDPSLWKERVAEPLRPAINLFLKDNDDLLHSNHWVIQKEWNKEEGVCRFLGVLHFQGDYTCLCVQNATRVELCTFPVRYVFTCYTAKPSVSCFRNRVVTVSRTPGLVSDCTNNTALYYYIDLFFYTVYLGNNFTC